MRKSLSRNFRFPVKNFCLIINKAQEALFIKKRNFVLAAACIEAPADWNSLKTPLQLGQLGNDPRGENLEVT